MTPHERLARSYLKTTQLIKRLEAKKDDIKAQLIAHGEFKTDAYSSKVIDTESEYVESLKDIKDKSIKLFDALHSAGCVRIKKATRLLVKAL